MDNSISSYARLWLQFTKWCEAMGLVSLPARGATVLLYVAYRSDQHLSPDTINSDLSAIRSYHLRAGYTNPTDHAAVGMARHSVWRHFAAEGESKMKAHPLTLDEVRVMVGCLDELIVRPCALAELLRIRRRGPSGRPGQPLRVRRARRLRLSSWWCSSLVFISWVGWYQRSTLAMNTSGSTTFS